MSIELPEEWPGYEIVDNVITVVECDLLLEAISESKAGKGRAGVRHLMSNSAVSKIANDRRLATIAERVAKRPMIPYKATLFEKTGKANWLVAWHQDTALPITKPAEGKGWGPSTKKDGIVYAHAPTRVLSQIIALRLHLDPSTKLNGPLRVIPYSNIELLDDVTGTRGSLTKAVTCLVGKGGVIAMSPLTLHASSKCLSNEPRRVLHIEYAPSLEIESGIRLAVA